jgi:uncharacterized repeat protein (TIGR03803 family)
MTTKPTLRATLSRPRGASKQVSFILLLVGTHLAAGQAFTVLYTFTGNSTNDGSSPDMNLVLKDGALYGVANYPFFRINLDGSGFVVLTNLSYGGGDNWVNYGGLAVGDNAFYGTKFYGGINYDGQIFKVNQDGTGYTILKTYIDTRFATDGVNPRGTLTLDGNTLYGATRAGGNGFNPDTFNSGFGTIFKMKTDGSGYAVVKNFNEYDGNQPLGWLALNGSTLYGGTANGGPHYGGGVLFKVNTNGSDFSVLFEFDECSPRSHGPSGTTPIDGLLTENTIYGITDCGGGDTGTGAGTIYKLNINTSDFQVLHVFTSGSQDGGKPTSLSLHGDTLYGTTWGGGNASLGVLFKIRTNGNDYAVLKHFEYADGGHPQTRLVFDGDRCYGTTEQYGFLANGSFGGGTIYRFDLRPSLSLQKTAGVVVVSWANTNFSLQSGSSVAGVFTNIPGATSPFTNPFVGSQRFFRLISN